MNADSHENCETTAKLLTQHWWLLALRGLAAVAFGIMAFAWPKLTLWTLILLFGAYAIANGVLSLILATKTSKEFPRFTGLILPGLISIAAGCIALFMPGVTTLVLLIVIASWAIVTGVMEIVEAVRLRKEISNEWFLILAGLAAVLFGVWILMAPGAGALALVWWIGAFSLFFGVLLVASAFRLRRWKGAIPGRPAAA